MFTLTNENSLAAKVMIREIIILIKESLSAITAENIGTYRSVLQVLQGFIIEDIYCKSKEEEDANITANRTIIQLTQMLLNHNLSFIDEQNHHELTATLQQIQIFFRALENKRIISAMNRITEMLIENTGEWQLKNICKEIFLHTTNQLQNFLQENSTSNYLEDVESNTQFLSLVQHMKNINGKIELNDGNKLINLIATLKEISQHPIFSRAYQGDFLERMQSIFQFQLNQLLNTKPLRQFSMYSPLLPTQTDHKTQPLQFRPPPMR